MCYQLWWNKDFQIPPHWVRPGQRSSAEMRTECAVISLNASSARGGLCVHDADSATTPSMRRLRVQSAARITRGNNGLFAWATESENTHTHTHCFCLCYSAADRQPLRTRRFNCTKQYIYGDQLNLSLIHIWRCRRSTLCRSRWSPYH